MRNRSVFRNLLHLEQTVVCAMDFFADGVVVDVKPSWRTPRCSECGRAVGAVYDHYRDRQWRHLDLAGMRFVLRYHMRRVPCPRCGVRVEQVPWAAPGSWFTYPFEDQVAYLAQRCDKTTVSELMRVAWVTVGDIIRRVVERRLAGDQLDGLTHIGIDELSYRRHHKYISVVVDHMRPRVAWADIGKNEETVAAFFDELGPQRCAKVEVATIDMARAYRNAVTKACPNAVIAYDRFHVQRLVHDALDQLRRDEVRALDDPDERKALKGTRWALLKNPWNLRGVEYEKLSLLPRTNRRLYRGYLLKEAFRAVLERRQVNVARRKLDEWLAWASRSRLPSFVKVARTIRAATDGILTYVRTGLSNGRTEALNGKIRTLTRRAYGFHSATNLIALIRLCCSGVRLFPVRVAPSV